MTLAISVRHNLDDINWSFNDNLSHDRTAFPLVNARNHHWYPATYIPEVPYTLIELLSTRADRVFDPFAGIGTTLWQAVTLGRRAIGTEVSLIGYKNIVSIWTLLDPQNDLDSGFRELCLLLRGWDERDYRHVIEGTPRGELLKPWFSEGTFGELAYLALAEKRCDRPEASALLALSVSAILKSVCEQRRGWGCIADNMKPSASELEEAPSTRNPIVRVLRHATRVAADIRRLRVGIATNTGTGSSRLAISHADARVVDPLLTEIDLVVTSPPYPGMTDYTTSQRLSYYWYGRKPEVDVHGEIGARRKRFKQGWIDNYVSDMTQAFESVSRTLVPGGRMALVLPQFQSSTAGESDARASAVHSVLKKLPSYGLNICWEAERILPDSRRHQNQRWTRLQRERLALYVKDGA